MMKYRKVFSTKDTERFCAWLESVKSGKSKVNAKQLYPHNIVEKYLPAIQEQMRYARYNGRYGRRAVPAAVVDPLLEEQWKVLKAQVAEQAVLANCLWLADMSGSMNGTPMNVAMALSLLCSDMTEGPFKNCVMSFSDTPVFHKIEGDTLLSQMQCMYNGMAPNGAWGMNTNLQAVFDLILHKAREHNLAPEEMPGTILILSDMEWDKSMRGTSNHDAIIQKYHGAGYPLPKIVYWNLRANTVDFPVPNCNLPNVALISGFNTSLLKSVMNGDDISPYGVLRSTIDHPRYDVLTQ
jgi:hypothetical protein